MTTKPYKSNCSLSPNLYPVRLLLKCSFSMPTLSWCWQALICTKVSTERPRRGTLTQHCTPVHISCRIHVARLSSITGLLTEPSFRQASRKKKKTRHTWHWQILKWYTIRNFRESFPIELLYFLSQMLIILNLKTWMGCSFIEIVPTRLPSLIGIFIHSWILLTRWLFHVLWNSQNLQQLWHMTGTELSKSWQVVGWNVGGQGEVYN